MANVCRGLQNNSVNNQLHIEHLYFQSMCDQRNIIYWRDKHHKFLWRIHLPFSSLSTYCTPLKKTDFLTLRIPEFTQVLGFYVIRRRKLRNRDERNKGRDNTGFAPTPAIRSSTQPNDQNRLRKGIEIETIVTKL